MSEFHATHLDEHLDEHLNDEQFSALLAGDELAGEGLGNGMQAHVDACAECRLEMQRVAEAIQSFSALSLDWAERRSATMAAVPVPARAARAGLLRPLAWAAATAVLALGVAVGVRHDQDRTTVDVAQVAAPQPDGTSVASESTPVPAPALPAQHLSREQQIAADNRMLLAIRHELTRPETLSLPVSGARRAHEAPTMDN